MPDLKAIAEVLILTAGIRGKPVGMTLFRDGPPAACESIQEESCTIARPATDDGRAIYFDAGHHDCLAGVYHCGMIAGKPEIMSGEYPSIASSFFTCGGAARRASGTHGRMRGAV